MHVFFRQPALAPSRPEISGSACDFRDSWPERATKVALRAASHRTNYATDSVSIGTVAELVVQLQWPEHDVYSGSAFAILFRGELRKQANLAKHANVIVQCVRPASEQSREFSHGTGAS